MKLDKAMILEEAFKVLNDVGLDKFNMRAIANNLSVSATALYWHYKNKNELISDMVNMIYSNAYNSTHECVSWQSNLVTLGTSLREELELHNDSIRLIAARVPSENSLMETSRVSITSRMIKDGLEEELSWQFVSVVISFVLGWMSYYQNQEYRKLLSARFNFEAGFALGLEALVRGFEEQVQRGSTEITEPLAKAIPN